MKKNLTYFFFLFSFFACSVQTSGTVILQAALSPRLTDSLLQVLKSTGEDTSRVDLLNTLCRQYLNIGEYKEAISYAGKAQQLAEKLNYLMGMGNAYSNTGVTYWYWGENEKALENHLKAIGIRSKCGDIQGVGNSFNNIGLVYLNMSNYEKSLENYLKALKIREEIGDKNGMANSFNNIGVIHQKQNNYNQALENYEKALALRLEIGDKFGIAMSYNNVGIIYMEKKEYREALKNLNKGLALREEIGDKKGMAESYLNIGNIYYAQDKYEKALEFYFKTAGIHERIGNKRGIGVAYSNIGASYLQLQELESAQLYLIKALKLLNEIENKDVIKDAYSALSELYDKKGEYKKAYEYQRMYADLKDTLFDAQVSEQMTEMNTKYESAKKDKELLKKDAEIARQQAESDMQRIVRNAFVAGFLLVLVLTFFIYRGYRQKQRANRLLDEKNEQITDSINYAKRIQESILPPVNEIKQHLPDLFILHLPKDIVSGDFYWFRPSPALSQGKEAGNPQAIGLLDNEDKNLPLQEESGGASFLLAAVDCTGHGVPGAFMSVMAYNLLEQVAKTHHRHQPAQMLNELSKLTSDTLHQKDLIGSINDGMDIALVKLIPSSEGNDGSYTIEYAGAHNSLYLIQNGVFREIKANKASIGFSIEKSYEFTNHSVQLQKGDCCYVFTDGFVDQFGGPDNEKFYYQPFRELLTEIYSLNMEEQKQRLQQVFANWKGNRNQTDDVLIIGFRI
jgi:tetratricopeptide (TPR) repeat protein